MGYSSILRADPTPWLLEVENPSVRYWTLIDILEHHPSDVEVAKIRQSILDQPLVKDLRSRQHPAGHWGEDETKPYTANGTLGVLSLLYMLGVPSDERIVAACDSFLRFCGSESGGFSMTRKRPSGIFPCTTGEHMPFLVYFGLSNDPRVRLAFLFLIEKLSTPDALDCGRYQHQECLWGAIAALKGLAVLPTDMHTPQVEHVIDKLGNTLLEANYDFDGEHKRWLTFGVPRAWDLISALNVLAIHGRSQSSRYQSLLDLVLDKQNAEGRWICGSVSRTWSLEKRNRPSKWVTLDVLRVLKNAGVTFT
jgi:hypothetical protein